MEARRRPASTSATAVTASVPELPALPALRDAAARRAVSASPTAAATDGSTPTGCCCATGSGTSRPRPRHDELRTYRVDRIEGEVAIVGEDRRVRAAGRVRPARRVPDRRQAVRRRGRHGDGPSCASLAERAALVEREVGSDRVVARRRSGAIEVAVPCANPAAFASWVLGLTDHAEVLSPKAVRDDLVDRLRAWLDRRVGGGRSTADGRRRKR